MRSVFLLALLFCTSCVSNVGDGGKSPAGRTATYLGIVRVHVPVQRDGLHAVDIKALGLGWDGAAFLGWRSGQWVTADPAKCQMLVIVRASVEAEAAARLFKSMGDMQPCIADFRHGSASAAPAPSSDGQPARP